MQATVEFSEETLQTTADLQLLQGAWTTSAGRCQAHCTIVGKQYVFEMQNGDVYKGTFVIDAHAEPKRIDMFVQEGPEEYRWRIAHCIYKFDGDALCWCPPRIGSPDLFAFFPDVDDPNFLSLRFQRVKPRRSRGKA